MPESDSFSCRRPPRRVAPPCLASGIGLLLGLVALAGPALPLGAQDVELLGEIHGTRPPDAYFQARARDPEAFRWSVEGRDRMERLRTSPILRRDAPAGAGGIGAEALGPREGPIVGTHPFPLVLGMVTDGPPVPPFSQGRIQEEFFDGPNSQPGGRTIGDFYEEMSRGLFRFEGEAFPWVETGMAQGEVTLGSGVNGLQASETAGVGSYIERILDALDDGTVDWSRYDLTGDGYVDILAVMHPFSGGECAARETDHPAGHVWSHHWSLTGVTGGPQFSRFSRFRTGKVRDGYETSTPYAGPGGGNIHIDDYSIQPLLACDTGVGPPVDPYRINGIGVFAHELGHALGLPDLYNTLSNTVPGTGHWDLMGLGGWGCAGGDPAGGRPCHMGAWSKEALGWLEIEEVGPGTLAEVTLEPVFTSGRVLRVPVQDGSREYLLLENRQRLGSEVDLREPGLLVWHIDPDVVDANWTRNTVNGNAARMGVWLRQADGRNDLALPGGNRADAGDPFPGCSGPFLPPEGCVPNRAFHVGTNPAAVTHGGRAMGIALTGITLVAPEPFAVDFTLDTRFEWSELLVERAIEAALPGTLAFELAGAPPESVTWRFVGGSLPPGVAFDPDTGRLTGLTLELGVWEFRIAAASGAGQETEIQVVLEVVPPVLAEEDLMASFLGMGQPLTFEVRDFLDRYGNGNVTFDLGDVRAYLQSRAAVSGGGAGVGSGEGGEAGPGRAPVGPSPEEPSSGDPSPVRVGPGFALPGSGRVR